MIDWLPPPRSTQDIMMNHAGFKEWQVVCDALASGRQSILLRKGGIRGIGTHTACMTCVIA